MCLGFQYLGQFLWQVICGGDTLQVPVADIAEMPLHACANLGQCGAGAAEDFFERGDGFAHQSTGDNGAEPG